MDRVSSVILNVFQHFLSDKEPFSPHMYIWLDCYIQILSCHDFNSIEVDEEVENSQVLSSVLGFFSRVCSFSQPYFWNTQAVITDQWTKSMPQRNTEWLWNDFMVWLRNDRAKSKEENDRVKAEYWDMLWFFPRCKGGPHLELCCRKLFIMILFSL